MGEHSLSARMQQKIDTAANWAKATNFVPKKGEIIVYSDGGGVGTPKIKIGDGTTKIGSLPFAGGVIPITEGGTGATNRAAAQAKIEQEGLITDANEFLNIGIATYTVETVNTPESNSYGIIDNKISLGPTQNNDYNWAYQTAYATEQTPLGDQIFFRKKISASSWTAWDPIITAKSISNYTAGAAQKLVNALTLNGQSFDGSTKVSLSSQQLGVPSAFIAKSVSVLDCNSEKIGRVLSSSSANSLVNGPAEIGSTGAGVLWNIPALSAPTSSINEAGAWQYLHQVFITGVFGRVYLRSSSSNGTAGNWKYGEWAKVLTDKNFASTVKLTSGGVNLLTNTKSFINGNYTVKGALQTETYNGFAVRQGVNSSDDAALIIQYSPALEANKSYTLSFWAKGSGSIQGLITGYTYPCSSISSENTISTDEGGANTFPLTSSWKRYWITFTMGDWSSAASGKVLWLRARTQNSSGTVANVCGLKWENGNIASDWTPALDDQKIGGTNYLPNLLLKGTQQNITATYDSSTGIYTLTGNGSTNTSFPQLYSLSLPCKNLAGKTCIFHVNSITTSSTALEPRVYVIFQDSSRTTLATGLVSLSTSSAIIDVPSTAVSYQYIIRLDQNKAHAITDIVTFKGLKLEVGNTPTDWSPAPEDVQHETSSRLVLQSTAWTGSGPYSAVLSCSHITANNTVIVSMAAPVSQVQYETFCKAQITAASQADGSITFTAYGTKPTINLPIAITTLGG